jgi:hypothetical protein
MLAALLAVVLLYPPAGFTKIGVRVERSPKGTYRIEEWGANEKYQLWVVPIAKPDKAVRLPDAYDAGAPEESGVQVSPDERWIWRAHQHVRGSNAVYLYKLGPSFTIEQAWPRPLVFKCLLMEEDMGVIEFEGWTPDGKGIVLGLRGHGWKCTMDLATGRGTRSKR